MIIIILLTIFVFASWLLIPHKITRYILGSVFSILLLLIVIGIIANMTHHFGMEKQSTLTSTKEIYSAGSSESPVNMLIANEIGSNTDNYVMVFKNQKSDNKASVNFKPKTDKKHLSNAIKTTASYKERDVDYATVQTSKTYWVWKSDFYKWLFKFGNENDKELISSHTIVSVPKDTWLVVNSDEAKKLKSMQQSQQSQNQIQSTLKKRIIQYKEKHPDAMKQELNNYIDKEKSKLAVQQIKKQIKSN